MPAVVKELKNQAGEDSKRQVAPRRIKTPDPGFGCVYIASSAREAELVSSLVESERIRIFHAETLEDARDQVKLTHSRVILSNTRFRNGDWKEAVEMSMRMHPPAALVVASRNKSEDLWLNVLERGAYDLIRRPFETSELCRSLKNAYSHALSGGLRHMTA